MLWIWKYFRNRWGSCCFLNFIWDEDVWKKAGRKKNPPPVSMTPLGIKKWWGGGWGVWRYREGEQVKQKTKRVQLSLPPLCPLLPPPSLHHLASGVWTTALDGGASVLSVLSRRLWACCRLSLPWRSPAASHFQSFTNTETQTHMRAHKPCATSEPSSLCSLLSSYVGLFVAAVPELGEEKQGEQSEAKK